MWIGEFGAGSVCSRMLKGLPVRRHNHRCEKIIPWDQLNCMCVFDLGTVKDPLARVTCLKSIGSTPPSCTAEHPPFVTLCLAGF